MNTPQIASVEAAVETGLGRTYYLPRTKEEVAKFWFGTKQLHFVLTASANGVQVLHEDFLVDLGSSTALGGVAGFSQPSDALTWRDTYFFEGENVYTDFNFVQLGPAPFEDAGAHELAKSPDDLYYLLVLFEVTHVVSGLFRSVTWQSGVAEGSIGRVFFDGQDLSSLDPLCGALYNGGGVDSATLTITSIPWTEPVPSLVVFPFAPDWSQSVAKRWNFDARADTLGFGAEFLDLLQGAVVTGYDLSVYLPDAASVGAWESWWQSTFEDKNSFWLPELREAAEVSAGVSITAFDLPASYTGRFVAGDYLWLVDPTGLGQAAHIHAVDVEEDGEVRVTLSASPSAPVEPGWEVYRLALCRLADDKLVCKFLADNRAMAAIRVLELPFQTAPEDAALIEEQPVWLYHFWQGETNWYFTSHALEVNDGTQAWLPVPITHGSLRDSLQGDVNDLEIETSNFTGNPLNALVPWPSATILSIEVLQTTWAAPSVQISLWNGQIGPVQMAGNKLTAKGHNGRALFDRQFPGFFLQTTCNHMWGDPLTCRVNPASYAQTGTISAISGATLTISGSGITAQADDWFSGGYVIVGTEQMGIIQSTGATLILGAPLRLAAPGNALTAYAGCNRDSGICTAKFANFANFGGHPDIPTANLTLNALSYSSQPTASGK